MLEWRSCLGMASVRPAKESIHSSSQFSPQLNAVEYGPCRRGSASVLVPKTPTTFEDSPRDVTPGSTMSSGPVREEHPYYLEIF